MTDTEEARTPKTEEATTRNTAEQGANIGIQAGQVHNSTVNLLLPEAPPQKKYEFGVRFLEEGVPARARKLIDDAIADGYEDGKVRFYWALAMLSKRTYNDLGAEERYRLRIIPDYLGRYVDDEWKRALTAIHELLECLYGSGGDTEQAHKKITDLPTEQRDPVVRHLDLVLTSAAKDSVWAETYKTAYDRQFGKERVNSAWAYFQADPVEAKARKPALISITGTDWWWAFAGTVAFAISAEFLVRTVMVNASPVPVVTGMIALSVAGCLGLHDAWEWHYRTIRLRAKEAAHLLRFGVALVPDGLTGLVHLTFLYYFTKYAPKKCDLDRWLAETAGIRVTMRDEIVDLYKKSDIEAGRVRWLIRYLVKDVNSRQVGGTLREYREEWRTRPATKMRCLLSFAVFVPAAVYAVDVVGRVDPVHGALAAHLSLQAGQWPRRDGHESSPNDAGTRTNAGSTSRCGRIDRRSTGAG